MNKILIGNKNDMESDRKVSLEEGKDLAKYYKIGFMETSAKNASNIDFAFSKIAQTVLDRIVS